MQLPTAVVLWGLPISPVLECPPQPTDPTKGGLLKPIAERRIEEVTEVISSTREPPKITAHRDGYPGRFRGLSSTPRVPAAVQSHDVMLKLHLDIRR